EDVCSVLLETKKLVDHFPERANKILDNLANNEFNLKVDALDEKRFTDGFQKVANRITLGLIIAATIIGAAMLMSVPSPFTIFGYPVLALFLFMLAARAAVASSYYLLFQ